MRTDLKLPQVRHPLVRRVVDGLGAVFQQVDSQQAIEIRRLVLPRNPQPDMIGVETPLQAVDSRSATFPLILFAATVGVGWAE